MQTIVAGEIKISRTSYFTDKPQLSEKNELIKSFTPSNQSVILNCTLIHPDDLPCNCQCEKMENLSTLNKNKFVR